MATKPNVRVVATHHRTSDAGIVANVLFADADVETHVVLDTPIDSAGHTAIDGNTLLVVDEATLKRIDLDTGAVTTLYTGVTMGGLALLSDNTALVGVSATSIAHIDLSDNTVIRTFTTTMVPTQIAVNVSETTMACTDADTSTNTHVFTIATGALVGTIATAATAFAVSLSDTEVYVHAGFIAVQSFDIATLVEGDTPTIGLTDISAACLDAVDPDRYYATPFGTDELQTFTRSGGVWSQTESVIVVGIGALQGFHLTSETENQVSHNGLNAVIDTSAAEVYLPPVYTDRLVTAPNLPFTWEVVGALDESVAETQWQCTAYDLLTGAEVGSVVTATTSFTIPLRSPDPVKITVEPVPFDIRRNATTYSIDDKVYPADPQADPYYFKCITSGTSGASEPTWTSVPGSTVIDGSLVWELVERIIQPTTHSPIIPTAV